MDPYENIYNSICRLCLSTNNSDNMISLTDNSSEDGLSCFGKAVVMICDVSMKKEDNLPSMMCKNCALSLKLAVRFKLKCEWTDNRLKQLLEKNVNKHGTEQDIKKTIYEFVLFNQFFPFESNVQCSKHSNKSKYNSKMNVLKANVNHKIQEKNIEEMANLINETYDFDGFPEHEDNTDHSITQEEDHTDNISKILECMEDNIHLKPQTSYKNQDTQKSIKYAAKPNCSGDMDEILDTMQNMMDSDIYTIPVQDQTINKHKVKKKKKPLKKRNKVLDTIEFLNSNITLSRQKRRLKSEKAKFQASISNSNSQDRNFTCEICHKVLANRFTFDHHMQRHNHCQYICDQCGKGFPVLAEMHIHQVAKHGTGPYLQCDHCPYKAPRKLTLIEHLRIHTGERPFTCEKCGLTFRRRAIWRNHLIHHMEKKFQCMYCPRKFYRQAQVLAHCNNVHERKYMYICNVCSVTYTKTETVRRHMLEKHGILRERQGRITRIMSGSNHFPPAKEN